MAAVAAAMAAVAVTIFARVAAVAMDARRLGLASANCNSDCSAMAVAEVEAAMAVLWLLATLEKVGYGCSCHGTISPDGVACRLSLALEQELGEVGMSLSLAL